MSYAADTHARVRFLEGSPRLGPEARNAFSNMVWPVVAPPIVLAGITFPPRSIPHRYRPASHVGSYRQRYQLSRVCIGWGNRRPISKRSKIS